MTDQSTIGIIIKASKCRWLKINTKPVRSHSLDGAVFPYLLTVRYSVNDMEYVGRRMVIPKGKIPQVGEEVTVRYRADKPQRIRGVITIK